jgi:hypothetical protein
MLFLFWMWLFEVLKSIIIDKHVDMECVNFIFLHFPCEKRKRKNPQLLHAWNCGMTCHLMNFSYNSRWMKNYTYVKAFKSLLLPQINGRACVDFSYTHPIDGLFWSLPIYLLGFFSKYECWVTDLIMPLYHFILFGLSFSFLYHEISYTMKCKKSLYD